MAVCKSLLLRIRVSAATAAAALREENGGGIFIVVFLFFILFYIRRFISLSYFVLSFSTKNLLLFFSHSIIT
jgi:hypothetical protein